MNSSSDNYYRHVSELVKQHRSRPPAPRRISGRDGDKIKRTVLLLVICFCLATAIVYMCDYLLARYRLAHGNALDAVTIENVYAIPQKSGKTEFDYVGTGTQTCVHALFPHFGYTPCWYLRRHKEQRTNF